MDPETLNFLRLGLIYYILLLSSVCVHEWAHAFVADKLGDHLPRSQGRVTLNPAAHIDLLGTVIFPLLMIFGPLLAGMGSRIAIIGWGKPVMVSLPNAKTRVRDDLLITAAGPTSNLFLCLLAAIIGAFFGKAFPGVLQICQWAILMNAGLCIFNLIPIPPLDGSRFLKHATGMSDATYFNFARWGFLILLVLINLPPFRMVLGTAIYTVAGFFNHVMLSKVAMIL